MNDTLKSFFTTLLLVLVLALAPAHPASAQESKKHVLLLNSYQNGYAWSDHILEGVREALEQAPFQVDLQIEYMDTKRYPLSELRELLVNYYREKYADASFDLILCADNNAFDFVLETRNELFPDTPVVFGGVNDFKREWIEGQAMLTGIVEHPDISSNIQLALDLRPQTKRMVVIGDNSITSRSIVNQFRETEPRFADRLSFEYWDSYTLGELLKRVADLGDDTAAYFTPFYKGAHGELFTAEEVLSAIAGHTEVMVFSSWRFLLGHGTIGGKVLSGQAMGQAMADTAIRVLSGESADDIPVKTSIVEPYVFDHVVLERFGIDPDQLPEGSEIINEPDSFYRIDPPLFWTGLVFMISMSIILLFLIAAISQRKRVQEKIKDQLAFQEILMDTIPLLVCWKDTNQRYLGANKSFAEFFGLPAPDDIAGGTDSDLSHGTLPLAKLAEWDREVMRTGDPIRARSLTAIGRDGATVWFEINKVPLRGVRGKVVGTLSTAEDVTRKVELKQQLLQSQKMEAIGTLAGGIAHDFNNILTSIINSCELALMDMDEGSQTMRDITRALTASQRGARVVKQILAFSRPTLEGFASTAVDEVISETVELLRASLPRNIEITTDIAPSSTVWANPTQLHQALMNLCTNAFQALREGGGKIIVSLAEEEVDEETSLLLSIGPGRHLRLTVADNGPGVPTEITDKIFDPFFTTKSAVEGTGLGLAVVHGIVKAHSGGIRMQSRPYRRTAFDIYLPCRAEAAPGCVDTDPELCHGHERILFVEDDPDQMETVPRLLAGLGYQVTAVPDGAEALETLKAAPGEFDLLITDFDMPGMDGAQLAKRAVALMPDLPVIMVSGRRNATEQAAETNCIRTVVLKPYDRGKLAAAIRAALDAPKQQET